MTTTTTTTSPFFPELAMRIWGEPGSATSAIGRPRVWQEVTAENQFTPPSYFRRSGGEDCANFNIVLSVQGTFTATVTLQRSFDDGVTWHDVETYTAPVEKYLINPNQALKWRLGVKTGDFTSGPVFCQLSQ